MRKHVIVLLGLAVGAAFAASAAQADPYTQYLFGLRRAVQDRFDLIPAASPLDQLVERRALARSLTALRAPSSSLVGDLRMFQRASKPIEQIAAIQTTPIRDEFNTSYYGFRGEIGVERDALPAAIDALVDARAKAKAQDGLDDVDGALVLADVAAFPSAKAILLRKAHAAALRTAAVIARATACRGGTARPGRAYVACFVDDAPFVPRLGGATAGADGGAESRVTVTGYGLAARDDAIEISWDTGAFTGPGSYSLDGSSGAMIILVADGLTFTSESGSVEVTEVDPAEHHIAGTFSGVVAAPSGAKRQLVGGVFKTCYAIAKR